MHVTTFAALAVLAPMLAARPPIAASPEVRREVETSFVINGCDLEEIAIEGTLQVTTRKLKDGSLTASTDFHGTASGSQGNEFIFFERASFSPVQEDHTLAIKTLLVNKGSAPNERIVLYVPVSAGEIQYEVDCSGEEP